MLLYIIIGVIGFLLLMFVITSYNSLVAKRNQVKNVFGSIDVMLKKRYDLIPNLVSACKEYMEHERDLLTRITELRTKAMESGQNEDMRVGYDNELSKALHSLNVAVENYPNLKSNENFLQLQRSLNHVEEQIAAARRAYNAVVTDFNNAVEMFPSSIMASIMGLKQKPVLEITEAERQNVNIGELFDK